MRKTFSFQLLNSLSFYLICLISCSPLFISVFTKDNYILPKETFVLGFSVVSILMLMIFWFKENKMPRFYLPVLFSFLGFLLFCGMSFFKGINSYESLRRIIFLGSCFILYVIGHSINTKKRVNTFLSVVIFVSVAASVIGLLQYLDVRVLPDPFYTKQMWKYKAFSSLGNPQFLAVLIIQVMPLLLICIYRRENKIPYLFGLVVLSCALLATNTRSSWLVFCVVCVFMLFLFYVTKNQRFNAIDVFNKGKVYFLRKNFVLFLLVVLVCAAAGFSFRYSALNSEIPQAGKQLSALSSEKNVSVGGRLFIWKNCLDIFKDNYLLGRGIGNFKVVYPVYKAKRIPAMDVLSYPENYFTRRQYAHNDYLEILAEGGVFTFLAFCGFVFSVVFFSLSSLSKLPRAKQPLLIGLTGSLLCFLLMGFLFFPFSLPASAALFFLLIGLGENYVFRLKDSESVVLEFSLLKKIIYYESILILGVVMLLSGAKIISSDYYLKKGQTAIKDNDIYTAFKSFEKGLKYTPEKGQLHFGIGYLEYTRGDYEASLPYLFASAYLLPERGVYYTIGRILTLLNKPKEAVIAYKSSLKIDPHFSDAYLNLGIVLTKLGLLEEAIINFERAEKYARTSLIRISALNNLSNCYFLKGDKEKGEIYKSKMNRRLQTDKDVLANNKFMTVVK